MADHTSSDILIAGAIAAFTVDLLVYPLDTLKTRIQSPDYARRYTNGAANTVNKVALFRGLYQGVFSVIIATLPSSGAFFITYEHTKTLLTRLNPSINSLDSRASGLFPVPLIHAAASSTAELVSCAILTPAEVVKQNAQMVDYSNKSSANATFQTLKKFRAHPSALWRGYAALAGRNLPFTALQFPLFERLKEGVRGYRERKGKTEESLMETGVVTGVSAGLAGSVAAVVTTPIDVVKTRIMLSAADEGLSERKRNTRAKMHSEGLVDSMGKVGKETAKGKISGFAPVLSPAGRGRKSGWKIGKEILAEKGVKGLWRGGALRGAWTFLGSGLYLGTYESGRIWLASRRGESVKEADLFE